MRMLTVLPVRRLALGIVVTLVGATAVVVPLLVAYDVLNQVLSWQFVDAFFCYESSLCRWAPAAAAVP
jgi:hypothetical protein